MHATDDQAMALPANIVRTRYQAGEIALGTYVTYPTGREVELLAGSGLDFVRLDPFRFPWPSAAVTEVVAAARAAKMTPWARVSFDPEAIGTLLDCGVQIITIPEVDTPEQARNVVAAVRHAPLGRRPVPEKMKPIAGYGAWAEKDILVGCQIETSEAIANFRDIIAVEGVDIIHTGRTDISHALGVPGEQFHPRVLEVERRIVEATLEAGKQPSLLYPATDEGLELAAGFAKIGVRIFAIDMDYRVLARVFTQAATRLRNADAGSAKTIIISSTDTQKG